MSRILHATNAKEIADKVNLDAGFPAINDTITGAAKLGNYKVLVHGPIHDIILSELTAAGYVCTTFNANTPKSETLIEWDNSK